MSQSTHWFAWCTQREKYLKFKLWALLCALQRRRLCRGRLGAASPPAESLAFVSLVLTKLFDRRGIMLMALRAPLLSLPTSVSGLALCTGWFDGCSGRQTGVGGRGWDTAPSPPGGPGNHPRDANHSPGEGAEAGGHPHTPPTHTRRVMCPGWGPHRRCASQPPAGGCPGRIWSYPIKSRSQLRNPPPRSTLPRTVAPERWPDKLCRGLAPRRPPAARPPLP